MAAATAPLSILEFVSRKKKEKKEDSNGRRKNYSVGDDDVSYPLCDPFHAAKNMCRDS
jgi:hypothetical protein